ncbi:MAG: adenine deaminase [Deltaproteobacteria bacterium]|nr:adenine deaminase [Deltaproteobacteria bacterium]
MFPYNPHNRRLSETALGNEPADLVIRDGVLADVYTGRLVPHRSIAVSGRWIAYVGPDAEYAVGADTRLIEAKGRVMAPGLIDAHTHLANLCDITGFLKYSIPGGTTTYVTDVESYGFGLGAEGFKAFVEQVRNRPVKIFCLIPPLVSTSPAAAHLFITNRETRELLQDEMIIGLGESYWQNAILTPDNRIFDLMQTTRRLGKSIQGHAAGAADRKLAAYAAAGAISCHEAVSADDILNRLEMGYGTMIREGYIRRDLESLRPLIGKIDLRRCILCTDGVDVNLLMNEGYFTNVVQKAVDIGIDFMEAVRMATLNPAEHLHMDHLIGGLAPGRFADIMLLPKAGIMSPDMVISEGQVVAEKGLTIADLPRVSIPESLYHTVNAPPISPGALSVPISACLNHGSVRTMDIQYNGLVAREGRMTISEAGAVVTSDPENDFLKIVYIERVSGKGEMFIGFVRGWGMKQGAVATSLVWDTSGIVGIGANDHDLTQAVNRVIELQGGTVVVLNGGIEAEIPAPIAGYISPLPIEELSKDLMEFQDIMVRLGSSLPHAFLTLVTLTSAAIPFIRITEKGYFRFRENDYVGI